MSETRRGIVLDCFRGIADRLRERKEDNAFEKKEKAKIAEMEAAGYRIVDGGQTDGYDDNGNCPWEITDYRTGEILVSGHGSLDDFDAAWDQADPEGRCVLIDVIGESCLPGRAELLSPRLPGR